MVLLISSRLPSLNRVRTRSLHQAHFSALLFRIFVSSLERPSAAFSVGPAFLRPVPCLRATSICAAASSRRVVLASDQQNCKRRFGFHNTQLTKMSTQSPMANVRQSTHAVCSEAKHVSLDETLLNKLAEEYAKAFKGQREEETGWGEEIHFVGKEELTVQYLLVLDAINFCFWPSEGKWEYGDVSGALKAAVQADEEALEATKLAALTEEGLKTLLGGKEMPNMQDRARLLREVGQGLLDNYQGSAAQMVRSCGGSAAELVRVVTETFPGFRDVTTYRGREVFFYKRAQIFVGDVWGALKGTGLGGFTDIAEITMFADYRVPQILEARGVLRYSDALKSTITNKEQIAAGTEEEVELRAWTVQAVERLRTVLAAKHGIKRMSIQVDWFLWEEGEKRAIAGELPPHHRTLTTFY